MDTAICSDEAALIATVSDMIRKRSGARVGIWGVSGHGARIVEGVCNEVKPNLVWLGDRNPALIGEVIAGTDLKASTPASLAVADVDVLVVGVRPEFVDEVIESAEKRLSDGASIVSLKGVHRVVQSIDVHAAAVKVARKYAGATPQATYSPWKTDSDFQSVYGEIVDCTLVDEYRCYELWQLVEQSSKLSAGALLEVGVWRGGTGALIAKRAALSGVTDRTYLCDTFTGVVKTGDLDSTYEGGEHADCSRTDVVSLLTRLGVDDYEILQGVFPDETGREIAGLTFRFCHVDVDVYRSAKDVVDWVWPRLLIGGIVVFDDYGFETCDGVTTYVNQMRSRPDCHVVHNLNGHAIVIKIANNAL